MLSLRLIEHGRQVCDARKPRCDVCALAGICPSAGKVGARRTTLTVTRRRAPIRCVESRRLAARSSERRAPTRRALGREELARDRGVGRLAVALGHLGDPAAELVELGADARQAGRGRCVVLTRGSVPQLRGRNSAGSGARVGRYDEPLPMLARVDLRGFRRPARARSRRPPVAGADVARRRSPRSSPTSATRGDAARPRAAPSASTACELDDLARAAAPSSRAALDRLDPELRAALELARDQIVGLARGAARDGSVAHERSGVEVRELVVPVDRAGCYVPGGRRAARVVGADDRACRRASPACPRSCCASPPGPDGDGPRRDPRGRGARRGRRRVPRRRRAGDRRAGVRHRDDRARST